MKMFLWKYIKKLDGMHTHGTLIVFEETLAQALLVAEVGGVRFNLEENENIPDEIRECSGDIGIYKIPSNGVDEYQKKLKWGGVA